MQGKEIIGLIFQKSIRTKFTQHSLIYLYNVGYNVDR
jgi:hypothetical protein